MLSLGNTSLDFTRRDAPSTTKLSLLPSRITVDADLF